MMSAPLAALLLLCVVAAALAVGLWRAVQEGRDEHNLL